MLKKEAILMANQILKKVETNYQENWKKILKVAWPLIIANGFWNLQLTIDRLFLGNYSTESLGAALTVMGVFWTPMALLQQTVAYLMTFVAQYFGAKRFHMIGKALWQSIYISIIGGLLMLLLIPISDIIFNLIGHGKEVKALEIEYFNAICYSALPTAIVAAASGFFTGIGYTRIIIVINSIGLVFNVLFDYLLIFGNLGFPALGITGAGYATALANCFGGAFGLYLVFKKKNEVEYKMRSSWKFDFDIMKRFVKFGIPSGLQWALEGLAFTIFLVFIGRMPNGSAALASSGIVVTVMLLAILPALGVAQAVMVIVGQHLGEKEPKLAVIATWSGLQIALMYILLTGVTFLVFPQFYLSWFHNPENAKLWQEVSVIVPYLLMFVAMFTIFDTMNMVFSFALKGAGDTRFVTLVALTIPWPFMVIPTWLLKDQPGAVYWAWAATSTFIILQAFVFWRRFVVGKWQKMSVIN